MRGHDLKYALITPARNEEQFIEQTIQSVISQTMPPQKWVIVSDGSTDRTDDIVKKYLTDYKWIELVRRPERRDRHFGGKVQCFNAGYESVGENNSTSLEIWTPTSRSVLTISSFCSPSSLPIRSSGWQEHHSLKVRLHMISDSQLWNMFRVHASSSDGDVLRRLAVTSR